LTFIKLGKAYFLT